MRSHRALVPALLAASLLVPLGCRQGDSGSPAQTTQGIAREARTSPGQAPGGCDQLPSAGQLRTFLKKAPTLGEAGGLFSGQREWAVLVNREGEICAVVAETDDPAASWPGSQGIAKAKAYTANAFSTDQAPMSTARLYTLSQPGHSLWGAGAGNPLNPACLQTPKNHDDIGTRLCGGTIVFGGGLPLYRDQTRVGGLGVSGDTPCTDHEIAKRIRDQAGLNPAKGAYADDITYSSVDGPSIYTHPLCPNTWRNNKKIGEEPPAQGY